MLFCFYVVPRAKVVVEISRNQHIYRIALNQCFDLRKCSLFVIIYAEPEKADGLPRQDL